MDIYKAVGKQEGSLQKLHINTRVKSAVRLIV